MHSEMLSIRVLNRIYKGIQGGLDYSTNPYPKENEGNNNKKLYWWTSILINVLT